ncbi:MULTISPECIES: tRNA (adenosine(37)-N6)-threonylcarbamoyltransferase complex ATPase subunit type 1 TsaE [Shimia]|uniref:tRNA (adenosine(37)-N6)-threonylcarbamoyltransferase complex ATPase subunit type 1 TsaE n=1 Tax=Shimia TaxID=573139 RepID=UPI001FB23C55|nr:MULTISPECIES: tRNA (adenosine(37)-N6)-threonylcarbamoyltransferase complex ATPase subunit type 1 TsaE [Shimia]MDV4144677.1 tRNA (adenosine(37)-N6)-threonylcarbamoyltransferase complex ATPase subunit type 1 TsaE [Shimia sp. FJ5]
MSFFQTSLTLTSPEETAALAKLISAQVKKGDVLLLEGEIGAGKTHFARSLILSLLDTPEDIPSPTFTLVQTYESLLGEIWHADLYRLTSPDEVIELGLIDAFEDAICLVEWPDRLAELAPESALTLSFSMTADLGQRALTISSSNTRWAPVIKEAIHD